MEYRLKKKKGHREKAMGERAKRRRNTANKSLEAKSF
jgi:hypothetical protein